jgi:hypothetical protein
METESKFSRQISDRITAFFIIGGVVLLFHTASEIEFTYFGTPTQGSVVETSTRTVRTKGCSWTELDIDYMFTDAGGVIHNATDQSNISYWPSVPQPGQMIPVQYLRTGRSRLVQHADPAAIPLCFALALAWFVRSYLLGDE